LSQHVNVSANLGYILNSNPKSSAMNDAVLLDRPDEFLAGLGFDFPVNKHFQLIAEARSTCTWPARRRMLSTTIRLTRWVV